MHLIVAVGAQGNAILDVVRAAFLLGDDVMHLDAVKLPAETDCPAGKCTLVTTAVTVFELRSGAKGPRQKRVVQALLAALPVLPFDQAAGETAASMRRDLESRGQGIGMADYLIAGICVSRSASLLTRNRKHFQRIEGLSFADR